MSLSLRAVWLLDFLRMSRYVSFGALE